MRVEATLAPSSLIAVVLVAIHLGAIACAFASALPWWCALGFAAVALGALPGALRRHARLGGTHAVLAVAWDDRDRWWLRLGSGASVRVAPTGSTVALPCAAALVFRPLRGGRPIAVLMAPDSAPRDVRRRLCIALRIGAGERVAETKESASWSDKE